VIKFTFQIYSYFHQLRKLNQDFERYFLNYTQLTQFEFPSQIAKFGFIFQQL